MSFTSLDADDVRPHVGGSCSLCHVIKSRDGRIKLGSPLELFHRKVMLYGMLATNENMETLRQDLIHLVIEHEDAIKILYLMREVLAILYSQREELRILQELIPRVIFSPNPGGQPIIFKGRTLSAREVAETCRGAIIKAMEGRLGLLTPEEGMQSPFMRSPTSIDPREDGDNSPASMQAEAWDTMRANQRPQLGHAPGNKACPQHPAVQRVKGRRPRDKPSNCRATNGATPTGVGKRPGKASQLAARDGGHQPVQRPVFCVDTSGRAPRAVNGANQGRDDADAELICQRTAQSNGRVQFDQYVDDVPDKTSNHQAPDDAVPTQAGNNLAAKRNGYAIVRRNSSSAVQRASSGAVQRPTFVAGDPNRPNEAEKDDREERF